MIDVIELERYREHITKFNDILSNAQWSDQFELEINMVKPTEKNIIPPELVQSFSYKYISFTAESNTIGTTPISYFEGTEPPELNVVLYNINNFSRIERYPSFFEYLQYKRAIRSKAEINYKEALGHPNLQDYFLLDSNGDNILPKDGTFLLPNDYYFRIKAYALDAYWSKRLLFEGNTA